MYALKRNIFLEINSLHITTWLCCTRSNIRCVYCRFFLYF